MLFQSYICKYRVVNGLYVEWLSRLKRQLMNRKLLLVTYHLMSSADSLTDQFG